MSLVETRGWEAREADSNEYLRNIVNSDRLGVFGSGVNVNRALVLPDDQLRQSQTESSLTAAFADSVRFVPWLPGHLRLLRQRHPRQADGCSRAAILRKEAACLRARAYKSGCGVRENEEGIGACA